MSEKELPPSGTVVLLRINTGAVRSKTVFTNQKYTLMRLPVTISDKPPIKKGEKIEFVAVLDAVGEEHWIDPWYIDLK